MMKLYKNLSGKKSGVTGYDIGKDFIIVQFGTGREYRHYKYTYNSAGSGIIEKMKALAEAGSGLSTFISQNDPAYEDKY